jgi:hypothetical protein
MEYPEEFIDRVCEEYKEWAITVEELRARSGEGNGRCVRCLFERLDKLDREVSQSQFLGLLSERKFDKVQPLTDRRARRRRLYEEWQAILAKIDVSENTGKEECA